MEQLRQALTANRPTGQVASIVRQLAELVSFAKEGAYGFDPDVPVAIGISGGRLRLAFMHPDMARFFGPAWQMPIGAAEETGSEQIVILIQATTDHKLHLLPLNPAYQEDIRALPTDNGLMTPTAEVVDLYQYEQFGREMSEAILLALGYVGDGQLATLHDAAQTLPPPERWVCNNMRRPFVLVGNAMASLRTVRDGPLGAKVGNALGSEQFAGLRILSTGDIPPGGFSSSSAVTVAMLNALNALYGLEIDDDQLVYLACQSEYGTGVRAGSLDQATEQKGEAGVGTLISSNPADGYRTLGRYPVPTEQIQILFPYSVPRDSEAWRWSWGMFAGAVSETGSLTAGEMRTLTGKAAELVAILTRLPLNTSFFEQIQSDLLNNGQLSAKSNEWVCSILRQTPLLVTQDRLRELVSAQQEWLATQFIEQSRLDRSTAQRQAEQSTMQLFTGWRDPLLQRATPQGTATEVGVPLRAMIAYLFGEVAKNFFLIHHPEQWIETVTRSQRGDRSVSIDPTDLPDRAAMEEEFAWEAPLYGRERLNGWLERFGATPFDFNQGLGDETLANEEQFDLTQLPGSNFFRGLPLIDLAEAMLHRAFGKQAVARTRQRSRARWLLPSSCG